MTPPKKDSSQNPSRTPGVVSRNKIYTLEELELRTGLKESGRRKAKRDGLRIIYAHGRGFVSGQEWIRYLNTKLSAHSQSSGCTDV